MSKNSTQEEISIMGLMKLFLKLWNRIVLLFLKAVLFVMKHAIPLVLLIAIGWGVAYFNKDKNPRYKRVFIVSSTEYSGEFLTQELREINSKFARNNFELKKAMSLQDIDLNGVQYSVKPIFSKGSLNREEFQYLNYLIENRLIDKEYLDRMLELSSNSYEVEIIYPIDINGLRVFEATLEYLRNNDFAAQMHKAIRSNIKMQIEENEKVILGLSKYVANLSEEGQQAISDVNTMVVEGDRGSDLGAMLYARSEIQKETNKLIAKKVQLDQNFRLLNHGHELIGRAHV